MRSPILNSLFENTPYSPEYILTVVEGLDNSAQLYICLDLFKINSECKDIIWEKGYFYLERKEVVDRFVDKVLQYYEDLKSGEDELDRQIRKTRTEMKAFIKEKGYITSSFAIELMHYEDRKAFNAKLREGLLSALEKDKPFLDKLKA